MMHLWTLPLLTHVSAERPPPSVAGAEDAEDALVRTHTHAKKIVVQPVNLPLIQPLMEAAGYTIDTGKMGAKSGDAVDEDDADEGDDDGDGDDDLGGDGGGARVGQKRYRQRGEFESDSEGEQEDLY